MPWRSRYNQWRTKACFFCRLLHVFSIVMSKFIFCLICIYHSHLQLSNYSSGNIKIKSECILIPFRGERSHFSSFSGLYLSSLMCFIWLFVIRTRESSFFVYPAGVNGIFNFDHRSPYTVQQYFNGRRDRSFWTKLTDVILSILYIEGQSRVFSLQNLSKFLLIFHWLYLQQNIGDRQIFNVGSCAQNFT